MIYLLKAHICLSIFLMIYWGFLRKNTFYQLNRAYFLFAIIGSILLPLLNISDFVNQHQEINHTTIVKIISDLSFQHQEIIPETTIIQTPSSPTILLNYFDIFQAIFLSGMVVLLCKLIVQFFSIFSLLRTSKPIIINQIAIRNLSKDISPFSFFNLIFININKHSEEDLSEILSHEYTHARQWHSLDVMLVELFCIIFWINPLAWMLRKFLKQNLEFLTDQTVLNQGFDSRHYQYNLLKISGLSPIVVSNNFNFSDLKLRIKMMNRKRSSNLHLAKYFITIPLGAMLILAFNISKAKPFDVSKSMVENVKEIVKSVEFQREFISPPNEPNIDTNEEVDYFLKDDKSLLSVSYNQDSVVKKRGYFNSTLIEVLNSETKKGIEGVEILVIGDKRTFKTNFQGIAMAEYQNLEIKEVFIESDSSYRQTSGTFQVRMKYKDSYSDLYMIKHFTKHTTVYFENNAFRLKDEIKYTVGNATDRKGNLIITPKTKWFYCKEDVIKELNRTQELELSKRPLYKINGTIVAQNYNWNNINIKSILNLDYWSGEDGEKLVPQFGELARNGIYNLNVLEKGFEINIKKIDAKNFSDVPPPPFKNIMEKCTPSVDFPPNALYVVDGKTVDSGYLHKNVQVEDIFKLEVMDTELAKVKYGDKGKKGVILISTKKINKLEEK
jgi:hypothetical protein